MINPNQKILIIEDDVDLVEAIRITLESHDYDVIVAFDVGEGFEKTMEEKPDLIILDLMFGHREESMGFELAEKIKRNKELVHIPILMCTTINKKYFKMEFSSETDGENFPVDDFVNKPAQPADLIRRVKRLLNMKIST